MHNEDCYVGIKVRINLPGNDILDGELGVVVARDASDEALVRLDTYKSKFDDYEDTRCGSVTVDPANLEAI